MDDQQDFRHQSDAMVDDAAMDAPLIVSGDERRMHVRAYNYWVSLLDGHDFPSIEDLDPANLGDFGPHSVLLDFTAGTENPSVIYIGDKLRIECDIEDQIDHIHQVPSRTLLSRLTDHYLQIIANRAPVGFEAEFSNQRGLDMAYRGILMPFSSDNDTIDFIYGVINWKQVVTGDLAESLSNEVDRVLAQAPIPATPLVGSWADGPGRVPSPQEAVTPIAIMQSPIEADSDNAHKSLPMGAYEHHGLSDWLASAREAADMARSYDQRGRGALYRAIGLAYDFALVADERPEDYAEMLEDAGLVAQERAPMTPIVKLVFGTDYDKTRLTEYATALSYAKAQALPSGELSAYIESFDGGLKGLLKSIRSAKRAPKLAVSRVNPARERARELEPQAIFAMPGDDEFIVLIARRMDGEHVGVIGVAELDEGLIDRALQKMAF